jgi:hypothetical protein
MNNRYKGRSAPAARPTAFRTFGDVRPLMNRWVLPIYDDPDAPPLNVVCDTLEVALSHKAQMIEADRIEFERLRREF